MKRKIDAIIIHCTATEAGANFSAADVDRWHRAKGWKSIGYHYLVRLDGTVERGRGEGQVGAHCLGRNATSIGVCYVGGLKGGKPCDTRTLSQRKSLRRLVAELAGRFPHAKIHGHNEFANKDCPCFNAYDEYAEFQPKGGAT